MSDDELFAEAVAVVLQHEGGYWDDPAAGPTNFGFALKFNPDLTVDAIRHMTRGQAIARYREKWWQPWRWRELPKSVGVKAFDLAVDMGPEDAVRCLQRALRAADKPVRDDGVLGTATITAAADTDERTLLAALRSEAAAHYRLTVAAHPDRLGDLNGWLARAYL